MTPSLTVYIVDDNESVQRAMSRLMKAAHFDAVCAGSVEALLSLDLPETKAVVLADIRMPGTSGLSIPNKLHELGRDLPVIFVTGYDTVESRAMAKQTGAAGYFRKPVDEQALVDAITFAVRDPAASGAHG